MPTSTTTRPRDRRDRILRAAGRAFSERGYHAVAMEDIAAAEGITASALYRHFPHKYALFLECATRLADGLLEALHDLPEGTDLEGVLGAVTRATLPERSSGGIYRWEARYLLPADRARLREVFTQVVDAVAQQVRRHRLEHLPRDVGTAAEHRVLAAAALGVVGSVTTHRTTLAAGRMEPLLRGAALRVAGGPTVDALTGTVTAPVGEPGTSAATDRRTQILDAAIPLFYRHGFAEVSMGQIARTVGLAPSALYRHYAGKADILLAACLRAADVLERSVDLDGLTPGAASLEALARGYVDYSFGHVALTAVAAAESGGLATADRRRLHAVQREHLGMWETHLRLARPGLDAPEARVLVHAALGTVAEGGRALRWRDTPDRRRQLTSLTLRSLSD
ncbi:Transcriptional regulator, TetR family [Serinicoccus hydrothermalis]|uniref:Transcriptional regulator, TetR family n=1 Tax=Serinicoccus hydrothermalis TaxID=1758689 RepID=A0A1B1N9S0_9MICO|nr:TetR/AcrR family transcriptional regulator [Serinicoccus hydrothermalis]ANS78177.1 Transcriptional regulator, TetR family [Serinicoccus hydrothermalis]